MPEGRKRALRPGFSLMHWAKRCEAEANISGRNGAPLRTISLEELAKHNTVEDGWCAIHGIVYNLVPYFEYHPGGAAILRGSLGKDASETVMQYHRWVNIYGIIGALQLGHLPRQDEGEEQGAGENTECEVGGDVDD
mmetsp:Transcript_22249/g.60049  ORF Transcript_22249/g.60049 Transcript_22249/m.60049 type:complete len:137 (-) Transcript_22249:337-747(-)